MTEIQGGYKRSVVNVNYTGFEFDFIWIDLLRNSFGQMAGFTNYAGQTASADSQGWYNSASKLTVGTGIQPPDTNWWVAGANPNTYVFTGLGAGTLTLGTTFGFSWVDVSRSGNVSGSNGSYTMSGDATNRWRIVTKRTDHSPLGNGLSINTTSASSPFITDMHVYRLDDEIDFIGMSPGPTTGYYNVLNHFRAVFKQQIVNLNPCAVRFMNWMEGNILRWRDRGQPDWFQSSQYFQNMNCLLYGAASYQTSPVTDKTVWTVAANAEGKTPATYQNGEIVFTEFPTDYSSAAGTTSRWLAASAFVVYSGDNTQSQVTSSGVQSTYNVGDVLQFYYSSAMAALNSQNRNHPIFC